MYYYSNVDGIDDLDGESDFSFTAMEKGELPTEQPKKAVDPAIPDDLEERRAFLKERKRLRRPTRRLR